MQKKLISSILAGAAALSLLTANVFADGELILKPDEPTGLTKVSDPEKEVKFSGTVKDFIVGGESDGLWVLGGDNGDIGISLDDLKQYEAIELDYTCDNPIDGTKIGFAFKIHVDLNSRTTEDGGYVFADYLPETWVPYGSGADGKQPIKAVNSLQTIYQTKVKDEGTLSVKVEDLLKIFPEDMDYMMALGIGADNNNDDISEDDIDAEEEYQITITSVRFGAATVTEEPEETKADTEAPVSTDDAASANTPEGTDSSDNAAVTTAATTAASNSNSSNDGPNVGLIVGIIAVVVVIIVVVVIVIKKKK